MTCHYPDQCSASDWLRPIFSQRDELPRSRQNLFDGIILRTRYLILDTFLSRLGDLAELEERRF